MHLLQDGFPLSDLLVNLTDLLAELNLNLQELTTAVARGNVSLALIHSRVYSQARFLLNNVTSQLNQVQLNLMDHAAQSEDDRDQLEKIESEFRTHKPLLEHAANISRTVSMTAAAVNVTNRKISDQVDLFKVGMLCCIPLLFVTLWCGVCCRCCWLRQTNPMPQPRSIT